MLNAFQTDALRRRLIRHVDRVVCRASVTFLANLILLTHLLVPILFICILVLHELPACNVSVHLGHTLRLD